MRFSVINVLLDRNIFYAKTFMKIFQLEDVSTLQICSNLFNLLEMQN